MNFTVYPSIDLRGGKVVRLQEGDPNRMGGPARDSSAGKDESARHLDKPLACADCASCPGR